MNILKKSGKEYEYSCSLQDFFLIFFLKFKKKKSGKEYEYSYSFPDFF